MEQNTNPVSSSSNLCRSGCGFYGNPATNGLCSKCHKDTVKRKQASPSGTSSVSVNASGSEGSPSKLSSEGSGFEQERLETAVPTVQLASSSQEMPCSVGSSCEVQPPPPSDGAAASTVDKDATEMKDQKKKSKCNVCRRKLGLTGFQCRCGGFFCSVHRYTNEHNCTFDYKSLGAQEIQKNNPVVVAEKVKKI